MRLIASAAYLDGEFVSEIGLIPPSFLPIGNKRLYEYQVEMLRKGESNTSKVFLSIPNSFQLDEYDNSLLEKLNVCIIRVPTGISLGQSILYCWNTHGLDSPSLSILLGDSLFFNASLNTLDVVSAHQNHGFYKRAKFKNKTARISQLQTEWASNNDKVISGWFSFSQPFLLMKSILESDNDFISAIRMYDQHRPLLINSVGDWYDFGHINSFFQSRTRITTQRAFNSLSIEKHRVTKSSANNDAKIAAELAWFNNVPRSIRIFLPSLLNSEKNTKHSSYSTEYLYLLPLSDLYVFGNLEKEQWFSISNSLLDLLQNFAMHQPKKSVEEFCTRADDLYKKKTQVRLNNFADETYWNISQKNLASRKEGLVSLLDIANRCFTLIAPTTKSDIRIIHGDPCFSNLLYDTRTELIKCIDPRGIDSHGEQTIFGDVRYDLAKLYHSMFGLYDFIIAGRFEILEIEGRINGIKIFHDERLTSSLAERFLALVNKHFGYSEKEILAITITLFISMLPLHQDSPSRQKAFIANALRLYDVLLES